MKLKYGLFIIFLMCISLTFIAPSCSDNDTDKKERDTQEQIQSEINRQVGMPAIINMREKKLLKTIYEMRDDPNLICYCYTYCDYNGKYTFNGKCIGYPIPYSTQYTNPQKPYWTGNGVTTISQADPNGLFSAPSSEATWVLLIDPKTGDTKPMYSEVRLTVTQFPLPDAIIIK